MIAIVDYWIGNLGSVIKGFRRVGAEVQLTGDPGELRRAVGLVLPGDETFGGINGELADEGRSINVMIIERGGESQVTINYNQKKQEP